MYKKLLGKGECKCCNTGDIETNAHVWVCPAYNDTRDRFWWNRQMEWNEGGEHREWKALLEGWASEMAGTEWKPEWAWLGMVPNTVANRIAESDDKATTKLLGKFAVASLQAAHEMWTERNRLTQEWELGNVISKRKAEAGSRHFKWVGTRTGTRGPKKKPLTELTSDQYKDKRAKADQLAGFIRSYGGPQGKVKYTAWIKTKAQQKRQGKARGPSNGTMHVPCPTTSVAAAFPPDESLRYNKTKAKGKALRKKL